MVELDFANCNPRSHDIPQYSWVFQTVLEKPYTTRPKAMLAILVLGIHSRAACVCDVTVRSAFHQFS